MHKRLLLLELLSWSSSAIRSSTVLIRLLSSATEFINSRIPATQAKAGGLIGVDMYLVRGTAKALLIDLGNNYIDGYPGDAIPPRKNAAEELLAVVDGLRGTLPLEVAITHAHPDHDGMTARSPAAIPSSGCRRAKTSSPKKQFGNIDSSVYTVFDHATKTFDLGGGRVVKPLLVRGHSNGCAAYLLAKDLMIFTGDSIGIEPAGA